MTKSWIFIVCLLVSLPAFAKEFEAMDGTFHNGLYYPRVDIIEWGEQYGEEPHIEMHLYSKDKQIEVSAVPGDKNGKPVLWIMYDLKFRNERICRHVVAPKQFKKGMKMYVYKDSSDPDYHNIFLSSNPIKDKKLVDYSMPGYERCLDENASNMPEEGGGAARAISSIPTNPSGVVDTTPASDGVTDAAKKAGKNIGVDYDNSAVPFSF